MWGGFACILAPRGCLQDMPGPLDPEIETLKILEEVLNSPQVYGTEPRDVECLHNNFSHSPPNTIKYV